MTRPAPVPSVVQASRVMGNTETANSSACAISSVSAAGKSR